MTATTSKPKLTAAQARAYAQADIAVKQLEAQLEIARTTREDLQQKFLERIPVTVDPGDAAKDVREITAGDWIIRVSGPFQNESFSIKRYLELGHKITAAMREATNLGKPQRRWTVKRVQGPFKPGSVEPA